MLRNWRIFSRLPPQQLIKVKHVHVFEGGRSALFITSGDIVYGIGANGSYNLLGLSGRQRHFSLVIEPESVERLSLKAITVIAVGDYFGVAINRNGELYHWGRRMDKRRGILLPHIVKCPYFVIDVACGSEFFVILTKEQKVYFRGSFQQNDQPILEFTELSTGFNAMYVTCGIYHAAMLSTEGQVYNCGYDHHANYRTWKSDEGLIPKILELKEQCIQVACGRRSTLCLLNSGSIWACGENDNLGVESENSVMKHPMKIKINEPIRELAATWFSNLFAASAWNGRIYYWGNKTRWPTILQDACVLLDVYKNKETPSKLGLVPVAPQLSPCSSFNLKTVIKKPVIVDSARKLERSLSADSLSPPNPNTTKTEEIKNVDNKTSKENQGNSKVFRNLPPGFGKLVSAGKFLVSRPSDKNANIGKVLQRALSPEAHPEKVRKPGLSVANNNSANQAEYAARSHSVEGLDSPPTPPLRRKAKVMSMIIESSKEINGTTSPGKEIVLNNEQPSIPRYQIQHKNPFHPQYHQSIYPEIPQLLDDYSQVDGQNTNVNLTNNSGVLRRNFSKSNPFLYDPLSSIEFSFDKDQAKSYEDKRKSNSQLEQVVDDYNPGTSALVKYHSLLNEIKSDVYELRETVNELTTILSDL